MNMPPPITFTLTSTDESCVEAGDGSITVNVTGGSGTIEYSLNNEPFVLTNVFTGLGASNYQVRIKNGAYISAPQNIDVVTTPDTQIPVISCPSNISVNATSVAGAVVTYAAPVGTDNCPGAITTRIAGLASGSTFPIGTTTITHQVTDASGLTAQCSFTVTVTGLSPQIVCPSNITVNNAVGQCGATVSFAATESTAIPASTITYSHAPGSFFPVGTTTVTATATNAVGSSSCTFTVTVVDSEFPVIANCPGTITANAAPGQCSAPVSFTLPPLAPTVDQQITDIFIGTAGTDQWQSFTAGRNGLLTQVDLYRNGIQPFNGTLTIYQGVGVSGTSIYSSTYNYPDDNNWTSLPLVPANQPTVTAGQTYTIRIQSPVGAFGVGLMLLGGNPSNQGTYFSNSYGLNPGWKLNFKTYVATASPSISATDNCSVTSFTSTHNSGDVFPVGTTPVTFSAVDAAGNATTCSFNVVVVDNQAPTITCPININLIATSAAGRAVNYTAPIGTDNCSGVSTALTAGLASGSTFPIGTSTVTYTATDAAGLSTSCSFTVTVTGLAPAITCPANITVNNTQAQCGANVSFAATETQAIPASTITYSHQPGSFFPVGTTEVTATATNAVGTSSCTFTVTVNDTENPTITCNAPIVVSNNAGQCGAIVTYTVTSADNCSGQTVVQTAGLPSGSFFPVGVTTNTFVVTDASGNTATCSFTVTVNDNESPTIVCPANITVSTGPGSTSCSQTATWTAPTATDNCGTVTITSTHNSGSVFPVGTTTVTYTVRDASNNQSTCSFTVTVTDNTPPVAVCQNATVILGPSGVRNFNVESQVVQFNPTGLSPNNVPLLPVGVMPGVTASSLSQIGAPFITQNNGVWPVGNNLSTPALNPNNYLTFTVNLPTPTTLNRLVYTKLSYFGNGPRWATIRTSVNGFSSDLSTVSVSPSGQQTLNFNLSALAPVMGSITFRIYFYGATSDGDWADLVSTARSGGTGLVLYSNTNTLISLINGGSYDNCGPVSLSASQSIFTCANVGPNNVVITVKDQFGNTSSCTAVVNVVDNIAPTISCPAPIVRNNEIGVCGATVTYTVTSSDNCSGQVVTQTAGLPSGSVFPVGVTTNTFVVTDLSGNTATCSFTVKVNDTENPTISCNAPIVVGNDEGQCGAIVTYTVTSGDNCPGQTVAQTTGLPSGSFFPKGTTTNTFVVTDASGNIATCSFTVTVNDTENPTISCNAPIVVGNDEGQCGAIVTYAVTSGDNCPGQTVAQTTGLPSGGFFPKGTTTNTFVVTDASGNIATCSFTVTVNDTENPTISCNAPIVVGNDEGQCGAIVTYAVTSGDNCPGQTVAQTAGLPSGGFFPKGTTTNTFVVTDASRNTSTCSFTVTVNDNQNPVITCPGAIVRNNDANQCGAVVTYTIGSSDNCPGQTVAQTAGLPSGSFFPKGTTTNTFVVTDASGNTSTCSFTVTVNDNQNPVITCPASAIRLTNGGLCTYKVQSTEFNATATDNCGVTSLTYVLSGATSGSGTSLTDVLLTRGTTTVTWTAIDAANNPISCSFNVVVNDDQNATDFMIYAQREVNFDEYHYIGGDVGVTNVKGKADFKKNSVLDPYRITAKNINVQTPSAVNNRTFSPATGGPNPTFFPYNGNTTGLSNITVSTSTTLNGNWKDVTVKKGITATITGNNFGKISIEEGAVVTFTASVINLQELKIEKGKKNVNVLTIVNFANPASVKVKDKVTIEDDTRVNVGGPKVTFYAGDNTGGDEKFEVKGENSQVTANIMVPVGKLHVHGGNDISRPIIMTGWYIIEKLDGHGKYVYWNKYDCSNPAPSMQFVNKVEEIKNPIVIAPAPVEPKASKELFKANVYPNPSAVEFTLQVISSSNEPIWVRIIDMNGVVRSLNKVLSKTNIIKVGASLASGTYIAEVSQGKNKQVIKLVKLN
jgi:large repetitive protein